MVSLSVTSTGLANRALFHHGEGKQVTDLDDTSDVSVEARTLRAIFWDVWYEVLRDYPWNFATRRWTITSKLATAPLFGFDNNFLMPADCVRVRDLPDAAKDEEWSIETLADGTTVIATDLDPSLKVLGTAAVTSIAKADPLFRNAFSLRLAMQSAMAITNSRNVRNDMAGLYAMALQEAERADSQESGPERREESIWVDVRA